MKALLLLINGHPVIKSILHFYQETQETEQITNNWVYLWQKHNFIYTDILALSKITLKTNIPRKETSFEVLLISSTDIIFENITFYLKNAPNLFLSVSRALLDFREHCLTVKQLLKNGNFWSVDVSFLCILHRFHGDLSLRKQINQEAVLHQSLCWGYQVKLIDGSEIRVLRLNCFFVLFYCFCHTSSWRRFRVHFNRMSTAWNWYLELHTVCDLKLSRSLSASCKFPAQIVLIYSWRISYNKKVVSNCSL